MGPLNIWETCAICAIEQNIIWGTKTHPGPLSSLDSYGGSAGKKQPGPLSSLDSYGGK